MAHAVSTTTAPLLTTTRTHGTMYQTCQYGDVLSGPQHIHHSAHSLYLDQPVGVGFSYGDTTVGTSQQAAADVWTVGAP